MDFVIPIVILVFSAILHEYMHGFVAEKLGDPTARLAGRLTLNPIPHIDPISSVALPILMFIATNGQFVFAAAKPVPVNPLHLREGRKDLALVALAGPLTNAAVAGISVLLLKVIGLNTPFISGVLVSTVLYNLLLTIINLIPIPPLDGSKVFSLLLPERMAYQYLSLGSIGMFILFFLLLFPIGPFSLGDLIQSLLVFSLKLLGL